MTLFVLQVERSPLPWHASWDDPDTKDMRDRLNAFLDRSEKYLPAYISSFYNTAFAALPTGMPSRTPENCRSNSTLLAGVTSVCQSPQRVLLPASHDAAEYIQSSHYRAQSTDTQKAMHERIDEALRKFKEEVAKMIENLQKPRGENAAEHEIWCTLRDSGLLGEPLKQTEIDVLLRMRRDDGRLDEQDSDMRLASAKRSIAELGDELQQAKRPRQLSWKELAEQYNALTPACLAQFQAATKTVSVTALINEQQTITPTVPGEPLQELGGVHASADRAQQEAPASESHEAITSEMPAAPMGAQRSGCVLCIDSETGRVLWQSPTVMEAAGVLREALGITSGKQEKIRDKITESIRLDKRYHGYVWKRG